MKNILLLSATVLMATSLPADWVLVENYEDGEHPEGFFNLNTEPDEDPGGNFVVEDPLDSSNQVNLVLGDAGNITYNNNFNVGVFPLPAEVPEGSTVTFYHRHMKGGFRHDVVWGLTGYPPPNPAFGGFYLFEELTVAIQYSSRFNYDPRTDTYYMGVDGATSRIWAPELDTYYHTWLVIDLADNTYNLYVQGGEFTEQTLMAENLNFKNPPNFPEGLTNPLTHMFMFSIVGTIDNPRGVDPFYIDDIYLDYTGENLSIPVSSGPDTWFGYPLAESFWADTGDWLGMVYTEYAPFIWSASLEQYFYIEDSSGWLYLYR